MILLTVIALFASLPYTRSEDVVCGDWATASQVAIIYQDPNFKSEAQIIGGTSCVDINVASFCVLKGRLYLFFTGLGCGEQERLWSLNEDVRYTPNNDTVHSVQCPVIINRYQATRTKWLEQD